MQRFQFDVVQGNTTASVGGVSATPVLQGSFPSATVTVYNQGTLVLATIYSDNGVTLKANPFNADSTGHGFFYAANNRYDVQLTPVGGVPFTWGDVLLLDIASTSSSLISLVEAAAPAGITGSDLLYADSTAHRLKMNNNNGGALTVAATSGDTFTTTTLTSPTISSPTVTGTATVATENVTTLNTVVYADQQAGATADAKIRAAITALPAGGGTVDCRGFGAGTQTWAAKVTVGSLTKGVTLLFDKQTKFSITQADGLQCIDMFGGSALIVVGEQEALSGQPGAFGFVASATANISNILTLNNQAGGAGFYIEGLATGAVAGATITDSMVNLTNPLQVGAVKGLACSGANFGGILLKITQTSGGTCGPINFYNIELDGTGTAGCKPLVILGVGGGGTMGGLNFYGGTIVHAGTGLAIVTIDGSANVTTGGINFYGTFVESSFANTIGYDLINALGVNFYGCFWSAVVAGADCIKIRGANAIVHVVGMDNFNSWTNNVNNLINGVAYASAVSGGSNRPFAYHFAGTGGQLNTFVMDDATGTLNTLDSAGVTTTKTLTGNSLKLTTTATKYNNITTTGNGLASEVATVDLTNQGAAIATTTTYAVPAAGAGQYRFSWNAKVTTVDAVSSTLGALTVVYTDPDGVVQTLTAGALIAAGTLATTSTGNTTTTVLVGVPLTLNCKASTNITHAFAYTSNTPGQMRYNVHIKLEQV